VPCCSEWGFLVSSGKHHALDLLIVPGSSVRTFYESWMEFPLPTVAAETEAPRRSAASVAVDVGLCNGLA
jgi:hypothetical protein